MVLLQKRNLKISASFVICHTFQIPSLDTQVMSDKDTLVGVEGSKGGASIMEGGKRQAEGEAAVQDRETRKKAKVS